MKKTSFILKAAMLATVLLLAGCGKKTEEATAAPAAAEATELPAATEAPAAAEAPAVTEAPAAAEAPAVTEAPAEAEAPAAKEAEEQKYSFINSFQSEAIAGNLNGTSTEQTLFVHLPPSYYESEMRYPVVYYLHGYEETERGFIFSYYKYLDEAFQNGAKEFIMVGVNGNNTVGGSFYVNSPVTGNWEDCIVKESVGYVDENYRTIKSSDSRGICGFSMGGFGAFNLSFKHPDIFGAVLMMSAGLIEDGDLHTALDSWAGGRFKKAYAQAFSPDIENTELYGRIPELSGTPEDDAVVADWEDGFGNLGKKTDAYLALDKPLRAIKIVYGEYETWIAAGSRFLADCLKEKKVEHTIEELPIGHQLPPKAMEAYIAPFFNENLVYEK